MIIPPAPAAKIQSGDTPCWDAALAAHHHGLVKVGVTAWADEGKRLTTARPRPRKKMAADPA
jgi:hypothetical protein